MIRANFLGTKKNTRQVSKTTFKLTGELAILFLQIEDANAKRSKKIILLSC